MPSKRARIDASTTTPRDMLEARPDGERAADRAGDTSGWTTITSAVGRIGGASADHVDAVGAGPAVLLQPLRRALGRRDDLTISLAPCLTAENIPEAEHRETADSHESFFRRSADTAALAAVTVTTPVIAAAPVFTAGFLYGSEVAIPTVRCHLLLR